MTRYLRNNSPAKLFQLRITVSGRNDLRIREKNRDETVYSSVCNHGVCDAIGAYFARVTSFA